MKRAAILTLSLHTNYGGILQAYALQTVLDSLGCQTDVLCKNEKPLHPWKKKLTRMYKKYILGRKNVEVSTRATYRKAYRVRVYTEQFIRKQISRRRIYNLKDLDRNSYDVFVVGSDQVWRPKYFSTWYGGIEGAFLDFAQDWNVRRISYAASFGVSGWEYDRAETLRCAELIRDFDAVSVREDSAVELCREYLGCNEAVHVLDPTMLLTKEHYTDLACHVPQYEGNLMCYILDRDERSEGMVRSLASVLSLDPFYTGSKVEDSSASDDDRVQPPVETWLAGFRDARYVLTDSFHACVFSIIFNRPFFVIGNLKRGNARFDSLLSMFGLEDRLISDADQIKYASDIDWDRVNAILEAKRNDSLEFLKKGLND